MGPSTHRGARKSGHSRRAMQGKGVFSLRELAKYFCLVEIAEDFRGKKTQILLFKRHFCFHCEIFVNSEHHRRKGKSPMILQNGKNRSKNFLGTLMLLLFIRACTHAHPYTHFNGWCAPFFSLLATYFRLPTCSHCCQLPDTLSACAGVYECVHVFMFSYVSGSIVQYLCGPPSFFLT